MTAKRFGRFDAHRCAVDVRRPEGAHRAEYVTFAWMTWEVTHDPLSLGYLGLAQGAPLLVFQLCGGVLADRTDRLRLLIGTQALTALVLTIAFGLTMLGWVRLEHLLVLAALSNTFRAFDEPSRLALIPQLIDRERLANAIALGSIPWQAGRMIGPSIAGILIAAFGGAVGFGLAAGVSYLALVLYSRLQVYGRTPTSDGRPVLRQFTDGLNFVVRNTSLIGLATALLLGAACMGLLLMAFSQSPAMWVALPLLALVGFSNTFYLTQVSTFIQQGVPDQLRGRVLSLYSLCWNLLPLGGLVSGVLAAAVDARFAILFGGGMVAMNALVLLTSRRLRAIG